MTTLAICPYGHYWKMQSGGNICPLCGTPAVNILGAGPLSQPVSAPTCTDTPAGVSPAALAPEAVPLPVQERPRRPRRLSLGVVTLAAALLSLVVVTGMAWWFAQQAWANARRAEQLAAEAQASARRANQFAYDAQLRLVQQAWDERRIEDVSRLLDSQLPERTAGWDLRGFEWDYWQRRSGQHLFTFRTVPLVHDAAWSKDGKRVALAGGNELTVWDLATGKQVLSCAQEHGPFRGVAFSPDGKQMASASARNHVVLWDATTGEPLRIFTRFQGGEASAVVFSPDGQRLACAGSVGGRLAEQERAAGPQFGVPPPASFGEPVHWELKVFDVATGTEMLALQRGNGWIERLDFSPNGERLAGIEAGTVKVWDVVTGQERLQLETSHQRALSLAFSPDGKELASGDEDGQVHLWNATGKEMRTFKGLSDLISLCVAFSPDGSHLVSGSTRRDQPTLSGEMKVWNKETGEEDRTFLGTRYGIQSVAFTPDGTRLVSAGQEGTVEVWNSRRDTRACIIHKDSEGLGGLAVCSDSKRAASACDTTVKIWDVTTRQDLLVLRGHSQPVYSVAFSPAGNYLASSSWGHDRRSIPVPLEVKVWDLATGQEVYGFQGDKGCWRSSVALSPDSQFLACLSLSPGSLVVTLHNISARQEIFQVICGEGVSELAAARGVLSPGDGRVVFSPNGKELAVTAGAEVKILEVPTGQELACLRGRGDLICDVAYSPDGKTLATGSADHTARLWERTTGAELFSLHGHPGPVLGVAFSPDGKRLASAAQFDETVRLWDTTTGQEVTRLPTTGPVPRLSWERSQADVWTQVHGLAFSGDNKRLLAGLNYEVKIWEGAVGP